MASTVAAPSVFNSSRSVLLPTIPELHNPNFLDILLPVQTKDDAMPVDRMATPTPSNPMIDALKGTSRQTFTEKCAPAFSQTDSALVNAFSGMSRYTYGKGIEGFLENAWKEDADLTMRLIWNLRSIHDGKSEKEAFYRAFGWLYDNHPRTAISNLHLLVEPLCKAPKKKLASSHGYWKDLLNILSLATVDELSNILEPAKFLHAPRTPYTYPRSKPRTKKGTPESRIQASLESNARVKAQAASQRKTKDVQTHEKLVHKLEEPKFRALYIAVARLFAGQLAKDIKVLDEIKSLPPKQDAVPLYKKISLAGKWAPTPGQSHDRVTNIATAISELLLTPDAFSNLPSILKTSISEQQRAHVLRSFYQRWILTELRRASLCPEPLMSTNRWTEIRYNRVASVCMKNNTEHFYKHDPKGFEDYLLSVESGRKTISGATLLPHELVAKAVEFERDIYVSKIDVKFTALLELRKKLLETQKRVVEAQWKTLISNLRESGSIENSIAVCDVSGSMGSIEGRFKRKEVEPILPAVSLSLILASLAKPPFNGGFITFSATPQYLTVDLDKPLTEQISSMATAHWGMTTDLSSVFLKLLLPLAIKNKVKQEDMIKRLFIFSDMQFDACNSSIGVATSAEPKAWATNYDAIRNAYKQAGYEVPQIVYWDLGAQGVPETKEVEDSTREGVAMMNGFSPSMMKVFMGEEEKVVDEWEKVGEDGESVTVVEKREDPFNPVNVMKKALMKRTFDGLVVVD